MEIVTLLQAAPFFCEQDDWPYAPRDREAAEENVPSGRYGLCRLRENSCFVSGHDFSRAVND
jgi:hypothetical protein